jgi:pimeloyl-ACP methyl ester carboxylesterase
MDATLTLADGRTLGYARYGDPAGRPVLALHGAPSSRLMFKGADAMAREAGLLLVAPDRPGYGLSTHQTGRRLADFTADALALMRHLALPRFQVLAISGGGPYGVHLAATSPGHVAALALVSPLGPLADARAVVPLSLRHRLFYRAVPRSGRLFSALARVARRAFLRHPHISHAIAARLAICPDRAILAAPDAGAAMIEMTAEALRPGADGGLTDMAIYTAPWGIDPAAIRAPTRIWQGTADEIVPPELTYHLARAIPGAELTRIDGAGHFWVLANAREVIAALAQRG